MKICLTLKIIVCGLFCVFPVDIKGQACQCTYRNGGECKSCNVGCYLTSGGRCYQCQPNCVSCSSRNYCDVCKPGYYGPRCDRDCVKCHNGSCTNNTCNYGCADGYYQYAGYGNCRRCAKKCVTCNSKFNCTSCIAGRTGSYCQTCNNAYYLNNGQCYQCNTNCLHDTCFDNSGECTDGCKNGWAGWRCNVACGPNCASCDRQNVIACTSCKPDYYGPSCNIECRIHYNDGTCLDDCVMGYKGYQCDVPCDAGCGSGCDRDTGVCEACEPTYFGPSCQHLCDDICYDPGNGSNVCHQISGECLFDCSQILCSPDGKTNGYQGNGVVTGIFVGSVYVIVLIIVSIFIKRRQYDFRHTLLISLIVFLLLFQLLQ